MTITPIIFGAYLKCQMKCWLRATGEHTSSNIYAEWEQTQTETYRVAETKRLITQTPSGEYANSSCSSQGGGVYTSTEDLRSAKWRLAIDVQLHADESQQSHSGRRIETNPLSEAGGNNTVTTASTKQEADKQLVWPIETRLHAIERISSEGRGKPTKFIPIRFAFQNKLDNDERMTLAGVPGELG